MNPFDLGIHLVDHHEVSAAIVEPLDSEALRELHRGVHNLFAQDHDHDDEGG